MTTQTKRIQGVIYGNYGWQGKDCLVPVGSWEWNWRWDSVVDLKPKPRVIYFGFLSRSKESNGTCTKKKYVSNLSRHVTFLPAKEQQEDSQR